MRGNLGLKSKGIQIYFPLTPELALAMYCPTHREELLEGVKKLDIISKTNPLLVERLGQTWNDSMDFIDALQTGGVFRSKLENIEFFNSLQISTAERFIFSRANNFELVKNMIKSNPELRHGRRMTEATGKF